MHPSAILTIDEIGEKILDTLKQLGWNLKEENSIRKESKSK